MSGTVEISIVSASFSPHATFDSEPSDAYAILRCSEHQYRTKTAKDQGRLPVWNDTFTLDLKEEEEEEAISKELVVQVFSARNEANDLLGIAKIPIFSMVGKDEATLSALINPRMGETGKLKVAWKWNPVLQKPLKATTNEGKVSEVYEYSVSDSDVQAKSNDTEYSKLDAVSNVMMQLSVEEKTYFTASAPPYIEDGNVKNFSYPSFSSSDYTSSQPTSAVMNKKTYLGYQSSTSDYTSHGSFPSYPTAQIDIIPSYPLSKESYPPDKTNNMYGQLHTNNDMDYHRYPRPDGSYHYPLLHPQEGEHQPLDVGYSPSYPSALEKGSSHMGEAITPLSNERVFDKDKGKDKGKDKDHKDKGKKHKDHKDKDKKHKDKGKDKEKKHKEKKDKKDKEKHKSHDSHVTYSQLPLHGYHPQYPPPPPYGHPPEAAHGYSPGPYGYSPVFQSYPAPQEYSLTPHGYSSTPQGYPPPSPHGHPPPSPHGHPPPSPHGYLPPSPHGYPPPSPHGHPPPSPHEHPPPSPHGYLPPSPHGYPPPSPHGYPPPFPHGYPTPSPHGYPQEYPSHPPPHYPVEYGYPSQTQPNYPIEHGLPGSGHGKQH